MTWKWRMGDTTEAEGWENTGCVGSVSFYRQKMKHTFSSYCMKYESIRDKVFKLFERINNAFPVLGNSKKLNKAQYVTALHQYRISAYTVSVWCTPFIPVWFILINFQWFHCVTSCSSIVFAIALTTLYNFEWEVKMTEREGEVKGGRYT